MSDWRYLLARVNGDGTETMLDTEAPLSGVKITRTLSGPDALTCTVTPEVTRLIALGGDPMTAAWSTAVYAEASGRIRAGALAVTPKVKGAALQLECVGFAGYPKGQPYDGDRHVIGADPLDEVRHIWSYLQGLRRGDLAMTVDDTTSSVRIGTKKTKDDADSGPYRLNYWTTHDLGGEIDNLAKDTPFDYREEHAWEPNGEQVEHFLRLGYPTLGRRRHDLRLVLGENIAVVPDEDYDGDKYASDVLVLGAGEGRNMVRGTAARSGETRLRRVAVVSDDSIQTRKSADRRAAREVAARIAAGDVTQLQLRDHPHARVGSFDPGDELRFQADVAWGGGMDLWVRVLSTTVEPEAGDVMTLDVTRAEKVGA